MKFNLLVAASALVVGLSMSGAAFAHDPDDHGGGNQALLNASVAVALSEQGGAVIHNDAVGTIGSNSASSIGGTGLVNLQQNNGGNSILQDQNTLGAVLNCSCASGGALNVNLSLAATDQDAFVLGNESIGAANRTKSKYESISDNDGLLGTGTFTKTKSFAETKTWIGSSNSVNGFTGTGLYNISQNNGNNSMLQAGNTVAAIVGR